MRADLKSLLDSHKIALLAIENAGRKLTQEKVLEADNVLDKFRASRSTIKAIQIVSSKLAFQHVQKELELQGIEIKNQPELNNVYVQKLNDDLRMSLKDPNLLDQEKSRRAGLAAVSAANRAYTDMQLSVYESIPNRIVEKVWITADDEKICPGCAALDGTVAGLDKEFPIPAGFKPYQDLQGPPLHVNCRCRIIDRLGEK